MKPVRILCFVSLLSSLFAFTQLGWAQSGTSSLSGSITDANQAVVQRAEVTLSNSQTGFLRKVTTDDRGNYQFLQLPPATYSIEVSANGFAPIKREGVQLLVSVPSTLNFTVEVQGQTVTLEVTGEPAHVNTTDATMGNAFNSRQIMDLPFEGRNVVEILSLQPGVTYTGASGLGSGSPVDRTTDTRNGAVNGGRSDQANITLDGVDNNDQNNGFAFEGALRSTLDSVEEFRVTTANSNADAGRSSGAQVTLVTKAGTNQWHGSAYEYNRSGIGEANEWFNKKSEVDSGLPNKPGHLVRNTYGATLGGPIKKDRAFFFLNWEAQRKQETTQTTRIVPSDNLRNGIVSYACDSQDQPDGTPADPLCVQSNPNITIASSPSLGTGQLLATLSPQNLAALDTQCSGNGTCPLGAGANPAVQAILATYPHANSVFASNSTGTADGFNFQGYNFAGATTLKLNTYIAKLDFNLTQNGNHRLFVRGNLQGDRFADVPQFPGGTPTQTTVVPSKGLAVGYTALISPNLINNFRYGFIRQATDVVGSGNQSFITLRGIDTLHGEEFDSAAAAVPVNNFVDDVSWTKGRHTLQVGANFRLISDIRNSTLASFSGASTNASWLDAAGIAGTGTSLDPGAGGLNFPLVDGGFDNSYDYPTMALAGIVSEVDARYNFDIKGNTLAEGIPNKRHFVAHEFETYVQDSWRIKPNLTLTYGLRWTLLQPPYEKNGVQVSPTVSLNTWFKQRGQTMLSGSPFDQPIAFDLSGKANHGKPYWGYDYKDFAPRLALAYSPGFDSGWLGHLFGGQGKSSIRIGAGMYYDHFGEGTVNTFDKNGSFGLSTSLSNPGGSQSVDSAPRIDASGLSKLPPSLITPSPGASFPTVFPLDNFAVQWGLDDKLKTPYSYAFDFSFERELPHNFVIETAYVGRIAHRLLQQEDLAQPRDIVDPASKVDYFSAIRQLDDLSNAGTREAAVAPIPYWENLFGATSAGPGLDSSALDCPRDPHDPIPSNPTATQNMYDLLHNCNLVNNESTFQQVIDGVGGSSCFPGCITLNGVTASTPQYYASQFASLYAWRSIGNSAYHAAQLLLKHPMSHGIQFDFNYTFSKSIDMGSDAERIGGSLDATSGLGDQIINAWNPKLQRAVSTFDTKHQLNSNWIAELPFGRGRTFGANAGRVVDTAFGGWQLTGLFRWTSGFPVSVSNGAAWATNWDLSGYATQVAPAPATGVFREADGSVGLFRNPVVASTSYRQDFAGEVGQRNTLRGPGYFGVDMGMDKTFRITENHQLRFSWEVFNVFNTVRFNVQSVGIEPDVQTTFGNFANTLTASRRMQFALRYSF